ncbi:hypothetical protein [Amycolatopsis nigrescens]|uniref:hypothetical protein n=1 Tax=Amycolatopsis nigrescens TaxID=381445 RepID=UPI0003660548|nr:hypothetical protein [Amycolatopsis nigrescens]
MGQSNERAPLSERRRRLREEHRARAENEPAPAWAPSAVSTVLAGVFAGLLGVLCVVNLASVLPKTAEVTVPGWWLLAVLALTAVFSLTGTVFLILRKPSAISMVTVGSLLGLLSTLLMTVIGSLPEYGGGYYGAAGAPFAFLSVFALVMGLRKDTKNWLEWSG